MVAHEELFKMGRSVGLRQMFSVHAVLGVVGIVVLITFTSLRTVPPAHVGLVITLGSVREGVLGAGLHVCNPLAEVKLFSTKTNLLEQRNHVPTKEGLTVDLDVAVLYHVEQDRVRDIYFGLGEKFSSVIIEPELSSAVRGLTSEADAKALYTSGRGEIQRKLKTELTAALAPRGIVLEDVLLKAVILPTQLVDSIELKARAEQEAGRMEFVLQKERLEADRKSIEAKGIAEFQRIVSEGISPALLQWKGIEATEKLSESQNAKIVIMGNSKESLPVILGGDVSSAGGHEVATDAAAKSGIRVASKLRGGP
mmetsp:Transcript_52357/g.132324  ORF Transcript_52357/g.132324 Transcript_52357/m.132324 type:complete len:311 (-) Transcript_52357:172-1104(-)|eukprot:CAMPEP_0115215012 /NCGR_PEP_ID=MMETSP0270-20121206/24594_1 /TAXON_ID=71861 /ORGANISM="Scrippsiella trochoidea, Strain CCMP3099" /LENGTH=310 /DNA_ID=CAMNT_0002628787 /DNA_START=58 /DNA_END=990 /DNA_ORIENTATION=+